MFKELFTEKSKFAEIATKIARTAGMNPLFFQDWLEDNNINIFKLENALKSGKITYIDLATAVSGNIGNKYAKKIQKIAKK